MEIKNIDKLADLCRIRFSDGEKKELSQDMDSILDFVEQIQSAEGGSKEDTVGLVKNVLRADDASHESEIYTDKLMTEAPAREKGYFKVKKIL